MQVAQSRATSLFYPLLSKHSFCAAGLPRLPRAHGRYSFLTITVVGKLSYSSIAPIHLIINIAFMGVGSVSKYKFNKYDSI